MEEVGLCEITAHPHNRDFPREGEEWDRFVEDLAERGQRVPLVLRRHPGGEGYECLQGHRRMAGLLANGESVALARVVEATDEEAFALLWEGNDFRRNADPVDEAKYVVGLMEVFKVEAAEVARRMRHGLEWVRTRQRLLDLGDEVVEAVRRREDRLPLGSVEEILKVREDWWPEAVQLVLHPELDMGVLGPEQARLVLRHCLVEPKARAEAWEGLRAKMQKVWQKDLAALLPKEERAELAVQVRAMEAAVGLRGVLGDANAPVPLAELMPSAPAGLVWVRLAVRHGLAVQVIPADSRGVPGEETRAVVDVKLLRDAEAALAEGGGEAWLSVGKRGVEESVARAKAVAAGEGDPLFQEGDGQEVVEVIEQTMQHHAMIDMGAVKRLAMWAVSEEADPQSAPEWVPKWARDLAMAGYWNEIDAILNWVVGLKCGGRAE